MTRAAFLCTDYMNGKLAYYYNLEDNYIYAVKNTYKPEIVEKIAGMGGGVGVFAYPFFRKPGLELPYLGVITVMGVLGIVMAFITWFVIKKKEEQIYRPENRMYIKPEMWHQFCAECKQVRTSYIAGVSIVLFLTLVTIPLFAGKQNFFSFFIGTGMSWATTITILGARFSCYKEARKRLGI